MAKIYNTIGTMSGTSFDGIDISLANTDGAETFNDQFNLYEPFDTNLKEELKKIKSLIKDQSDIVKLQSQKSFQDIEDRVSDLHIKLIKEIILKSTQKIDLIGFHGITLYHNAEEKFTYQAGNANRVFEETKIPVVHNFRKEDLNNNGQGAPLTPIFHKYILKKLLKNNLKFDAIINIGGISNITYLKNDLLYASDIGPGNCLIDQWCNLFFDKDFDDNGQLSNQMTPDLIVANNYIDRFTFNKNLSFDYSDFSISEFRGLGESVGIATLVYITANLILAFLNEKNINKALISGGGRKNKTLMNYLKDRVIDIDEIKLNGDFLESQSFSYIAARCMNKLPVTYPETTGVDHETIGGEFIY